MPYYSTPQEDFQVVKLPDSTGQEKEFYVNPNTGEVVETLQDDKFAWKQRKLGTLTLSDAYAAGGDDRRSDRTSSCATWLQFLASGDGSTKQLHHFNACKQRLCPLCAARKAKLNAQRLGQILGRVHADHPDTQLIFLTLTIKNVSGDELRNALDLLTDAWRKLTNRRPVKRAIKGWFRAIEITRNRKDNTYHPHIHSILVVENDYFARNNPIYIKQDKWTDIWKESLNVSYKPRVDVRSTYAKNKKNKTSKGAAAARAAAVEAAKYATKDSDYLRDGMSRKEQAEVVRVYTEALSRKRMTAMGGWIKDAAVDLKLELESDKDDLVHDEDGKGTLTEKTAELLVDYGWYFGFKEYLMTSRAQNPKYMPPVLIDDED